MLMLTYNELRKPKMCHHAARGSVRTCQAHLGSSCATRCFQSQKDADRHRQCEQEHNSHPGSTAGHQHVPRTEAPRACDPPQVTPPAHQYRLYRDKRARQLHSDATAPTTTMISPRTTAQTASRVVGEDVVGSLQHRAVDELHLLSGLDYILNLRTTRSASRSPSHTPKDRRHLA